MNELFDTSSAMYVLGHLMQNPNIINSNKYMLSLGDFTKQFYKIVFGAIANLANVGAKIIYPQDIDLYLGQYTEQYKIFSDNKGLEFMSMLQAGDIGHDIGQFELHYDRMKKFTVLRELQKSGIDTVEFYNSNADFLSLEKEQSKLDGLTIEKILDLVKLKLAKIEKNNISKDGEFLINSADGMRTLLQSFKTDVRVGAELDGDLLNYCLMGAQPGKMVCYSGGTGGGKTRMMVGNVCKLSLPRIENGKVITTTSLKKTYYIATEQTPDEIQLLLIANVSGVGADRIQYNMMNAEEEERVDQAVKIIEAYSENVIIDLLPDPTISELRSKILEVVLDKDVDCIVYDYIFIPNDDDTTSRRDYRNDQILMKMSKALKDIAQVYNVFILTGTQLSGDVGGCKVRDERFIRDGKSIADKVDVGLIGVYLADDEEFNAVKPYFDNIPLKPNIVIDLYKNRSGAKNKLKIWRYFDYATCRATDLLVTTQTYKLVKDIGKIDYAETTVVDLLDFLTERDK